MPRDSRGRYTARRRGPRLVGAGRKLRIVGQGPVEGGTVDGVTTGATLTIGGAEPAPKSTKASSST